MTQETVSSRGGSQAVRSARRDEAALLGEVLADAFAEDPVLALADLAAAAWRPPPPGAEPWVAGGAPATGMSRSRIGMPISHIYAFA